MANEKHILILKKSVEDWNKWRSENPALKPDLSGADLSGANLSDADLSDADLSDANLSGANLSYANISSANISKANLVRANFNNAAVQQAKLREANLIRATFTKATLTEANLSKANLRGANLNGALLDAANLNDANLNGAFLGATNISEALLMGADLRDAYLREANFSGANLAMANLSGADLSGTNFKSANMIKAKLSSRLQINALLNPLESEQLQGIIFQDEQEEARERKEKGKVKNRPKLVIKFHDEIPWKNETAGFWLFAVQYAYTRIHYLLTTKETDLDTIRKALIEGRTYVEPKDDIELSSIQLGSPWYIEYLPYAYEYAPVVALALTALVPIVNSIGINSKLFAEVFKTNAETAKIKAESEKVKAEAKKVDAETEKIRAETDSIRLENASKALALRDQYIRPFSPERLEAFKNNIQQDGMATSNITVKENFRDLSAIAAQKLILLVSSLEELHGALNVTAEMQYPEQSDKNHLNDDR